VLLEVFMEGLVLAADLDFGFGTRKLDRVELIAGSRGLKVLEARYWSALRIATIPEIGT
jgi:hypothetical protein